MNILVTVKRVIDYNLRVRVKSDHSGVELSGVKMSINPFCEIAVEQAVRLKEQGIAHHIDVVSFGPQEAEEQLRHALAIGADEAFLYTTQETLAPLTVARALQCICQERKPDLVITGKQSIDSDNNQVGQMLAGLLDWPQATFVSHLGIENDNLQVVREVDQGLEHLQMALPAVVTTDLRLNEPRYLALPQILQARNKPLNVQPFSALDVVYATGIEVVKVTPPLARGVGVKVESVKGLIEKLRDEAKVLP